MMKKIHSVYMYEYRKRMHIGKINQAVYNGYIVITLCLIVLY